MAFFGLIKWNWDSIKISESKEAPSWEGMLRCWESHIEKTKGTHTPYKTDELLISLPYYQIYDIIWNNPILLCH